MTSPSDPLADLSAVQSRLEEVATRLEVMSRAVDDSGREDLVAELTEIERLVESAARRARRLLRRS